MHHHHKINAITLFFALHSSRVDTQSPNQKGDYCCSGKLVEQTRCIICSFCLMGVLKGIMMDHSEKWVWRR
ncbi:hypothetical protein BDV25DRAFT_150613 [Aspergillus avenaceus]|uniref:Secreted protein n=1 Tax=Aspergillus avenaceus TaxID=36643 RepID=A0A5N6U268_ASPAV|nr:hypothetical protein BDV25DRAFT_150613 [Aspergillus avenaceus]